MVTKNPEIIRNYLPGIILTPNAIEFSRLAKAVLDKEWEATPNPDPEHVRSLAVALGRNTVVVHKGLVDVICSGCDSSDGVPMAKCTVGGSGRRCGGQGDILSGGLGTFYCWATAETARDWPEGAAAFPPEVVAAYAACRLTRECNQQAVAKKGRSALATDMLEEIHTVFEALFEN
jgi:ATP-dependent NAD(P)H-hydrate dehydratase